MLQKLEHRDLGILSSPPPKEKSTTTFIKRGLNSA